MELTRINYQTETEAIEVVALDGHAWVTIPQIAQILEVSERTVQRKVAELSEDFKKRQLVTNLSLVHQEGGRTVTRNVNHYSDKALLRIAFRVNSEKAFAFQDWATEVIATLKRDGVVYDTSVKQPRILTDNYSEMEKWDYQATHDLLDALSVPPMKTLTARVGLLIGQSRPRLPLSPQKKEERVLRLVKKFGPLTAAQIRQRSGNSKRYRLSKQDVEEALTALLDTGEVIVENKKYWMADDMVITSAGPPIR